MEPLLGSHADSRAGVASGSGSGGRLSKAGVSGRAGQELPPINLPSPRELLRGFAFCLANYSASTLFLSWGAGALCRALIKRKPAAFSITPRVGLPAKTLGAAL